MVYTSHLTMPLLGQGCSVPAALYARNEKPLRQAGGGSDIITTCAYGQLLPSSCVSRWASHNARACEPLPKHLCEHIDV